ALLRAVTPPLSPAQGPLAAPDPSRKSGPEDRSDDQFDTTAATRTSSSASAPATMSLRLRLMTHRPSGTRKSAGVLSHGAVAAGVRDGRQGHARPRPSPIPTTAGTVSCGSRLGHSALFGCRLPEGASNGRSGNSSGLPRGAARRGHIAVHTL